MNQGSIFCKFDVLYFVILALMLTIPSRLDPALFLQIHHPLQVESHKNFPPFLAHQEISLNNRDDLDLPATDQIIELSTLSLTEEINVLELSDAKTLILDEVSLFRSELAHDEIPSALIETERVNFETTRLETIESSPGVANLPVDSQTKFDLRGSISIQQGLGFTNDYALEIRRVKEGVVLESGTVNIHEATYAISVSDTLGHIRGRILDKKGHVLGEGLGRIVLNSQNGLGKNPGPKLVLVPTEGVGGFYYSQYDAGSKKTLSGGSVRILHGSEEVAQDEDSQVKETRLGQGSMTLLSVHSPKNYLASQKIVYAGEKFNLPVLPEKMVKSLREIVSDQRKQDLNDPYGTLIWGQVKIDGMPLSGVTIEIESAPDILPVYLNEYFFPDPGLKATSTNGYFAFLQVEPGLHSLLALRGEKYFSHDNVITQRGSVSISEIKGTAASKLATLRVFDRFSKAAKEAVVEFQSIESPVQTESGQAAILLPQINRLSLMNVNPGGPYARGVYQHNDLNDFVEIPLIQSEWLQQVKAELKMNSIPGRGTIVGFVNDENFEVYSALEDPGVVKVYFDRSGLPLEKKHGVAGGGFILFNVPLGTNEAVVFGDRSQKLYSQVVPVDSGSLNVLTFKSGF